MRFKTRLVMTHTEWRGVVLGEDLVFGLVRVQKQKMVQVTYAVSKGANGEVLSCVGQQIPDQPFTYNIGSNMTIPVKQT